jgi:hypothetical protein
MDIAAKLSGKYTLADVCKQLFHQARACGGCHRGNRVGLILRVPVGRHPTSRHHRFKRAGYTMFRVGRFPKLFPAAVTMKMPSSYSAFTASAHACKNGRRELDLWAGRRRCAQPQVVNGCCHETRSSPGLWEYGCPSRSACHRLARLPERARMAFR